MGYHIQFFEVKKRIHWKLQCFYLLLIRHQKSFGKVLLLPKNRPFEHNCTKTTTKVEKFLLQLCKERIRAKRQKIRLGNVPSKLPPFIFRIFPLLPLFSLVDFLLQFSCKMPNKLSTFIRRSTMLVKGRTRFS